MGLKHAAVFSKIKELTASNLAVGTCMKEIIDLCSRDVPHAGWESFSSLGYDEDVASLASWIPNVFKREPAHFPIKGLWIGIHNLSDGQNKEWADMYVAAMGNYDPEDEDFAWVGARPRHYPDDSDANSASLRSIYEIARSTGLGNNAEWPLCWAFSAFAVRVALGKEAAKLISPTIMPVGVVVGFDGGDMFKVGELTESGFKA